MNDTEAFGPGSICEQALAIAIAKRIPQLSHSIKIAMTSILGHAQLLERKHPDLANTENLVSAAKRAVELAELLYPCFDNDMGIVQVIELVESRHTALFGASMPIETQIRGRDFEVGAETARILFCILSTAIEAAIEDSAKNEDGGYFYFRVAKHRRTIGCDALKLNSIPEELRWCANQAGIEFRERSELLIALP